MSYTLHQTEGFVLARWPRGEADSVLRFYTKEYGGVTLAAKGVRLEKSKLRGALDLFSRSRIGFIAGKEVFRLTHAELLDGYSFMREDAARYRAFGYVADMFRHAVADGEADAVLWELLTAMIALLGGNGFHAPYLSAYLVTFEILFFQQLGYVPALLPPQARHIVSMGVAALCEERSQEDEEELVRFLQPLRRYAMPQLRENT